MSRRHMRNISDRRLLLQKRNRILYLLISINFVAWAGGTLLLPSEAQTSSSTASKNIHKKLANEKLATVQLGLEARPGGRSGDEEDALVWRLPVIFTFREPEGVFVHSEPYQDSDLRAQSLLVSINGRPLHGKTATEIQKLCAGREGDQVVLGVLDSEGAYATYTFKFKLLRPNGHTPRVDLPSLLAHFDCSNGPQWETTRFEETYFDSNDLDLCVFASCRDRLKLAKDDPASSQALIDSVAVDSVGPLLTQGNLPEARSYLKIIETIPVFDSDKPRQFDKEYGRLLTMLDTYGLNAEAVTIGKPVIAADQAGKFFGQGDHQYQAGEVKLPTYKAYVRNLARTKASDLAPAIEIVQAEMKQSGFRGGDAQLWFGDFYESVGQYDKAITCYETRLAAIENVPARTHTSDDSPDQIVTEARFHCYLLYRLAQFANKQSNSQKALDYLQRAQKIYTAFFTEEKLAHMESVPLFSPSPSAIELALAELYLRVGDSDSAVKYTKTAIARLQKSQANNLQETVRDLNNQEAVEVLESGRWTNQVAQVRPLSQRDVPTNEERDFVSMLKSADDAITSGDSAYACKTIDFLLDYYQNRETLTEFPRPCINMYCSLLHLARRLADHGKFEESNKLFDQLEGSRCALDRTWITQFFIDVERALNAELAKCPSAALWNKVFDESKCSYTDYQELRALACLYLAAGEDARANIMLNEALNHCKDKTKHDASAAFSAALLYLDKACLACSTSRFDEAERYFEKSMVITGSLPVSSPSRDLDVFNGMFMIKTVQLAQLNRLSNRFDEAQRILKEVISQLENKNSWLGVFEPSDHRSVDRSQPYVYGYYGRLLCDRGKFREARPYLDKAVSACGSNVPNFLLSTRARCAAQQGDNALAAKDLSALVEHSAMNSLAMSVQPTLRQQHIRTAITYALKAKGFNPDELAKLSKQLADLLDRSSLKEKLALSQKAYTLTSDNSQDKRQLAQQIAGLKSSLGIPPEPPSAADLKARESAAMVAEKNGDAKAAHLWMDLAGSDIQVKQYDQAIERINKAIDSLRDRPIYNAGGVGVSQFINLPIHSLVDAGRTKDAETLYLKMLDKTRSVFGATSTEYSCALGRLTIFYTSQNNQEKSMNYLDQLLALDPRREELGKQSNEENGRKLVLQSANGLLYKDGHDVLAMQILEKLLDAQRKTYGSDDSHVAEVLTQIGLVETKNGVYDRAEEHLRAALAIDALYDNGVALGGGGSGANSAIQSLFEKEHKTNELENLFASRKTSRKETEKHWSLAENASDEQAQEFYDWWHKKAPYGYRCLSAGMTLLQRAVKRKDWHRVQELAPECLKILSHNPLYVVGGCTPSPQPAAQKFLCIKSEIEACIELSQSDEAKKWLNRAVSEESYSPVIEEFVFLSEIEFACGDKKEALAFCKQAEDRLQKDGRWDYYRFPVNELYRKLGSVADIKRLDADNRAKLLKQQEEELLKFEAERKRKAQQPQLKPPPPSATLTDRQTDEAETSIEPRESLIFPRVEGVKDKFLFNYAAYASDALWLPEQAVVMRHPEGGKMSSHSFAGSYSSMACCQPLHKAGEFLFLYDGPKGSLMPKFELASASAIGPHGKITAKDQLKEIFTAPPPVMSRPFREALQAPANATALPGGERLVLKPGDYSAEHISTNSIVLSTPGRTRIFLKDTEAPSSSIYIEPPKSIFVLREEDPSIKPVFEATDKGQINLDPATEKMSAPKSSLELWYKGTGEIKLGDNVYFNRIIYAPNAIIRLGKKVHFWGAMVAKTILAGEESRLMYQTNLNNWVAEPVQTK
jgi:tetratricopeptide (TPR) repeat protein